MGNIAGCRIEERNRTPRHYNPDLMAPLLFLNKDIRCSLRNTLCKSQVPTNGSVGECVDVIMSRGRCRKRSQQFVYVNHRVGITSFDAISNTLDLTSGGLSEGQPICLVFHWLSLSCVQRKKLQRKDHLWQVSEGRRGREDADWWRVNLLDM